VERDRTIAKRFMSMGRGLGRKGQGAMGKSYLVAKVTTL
jgi:hypothetical protein